MRSCSNGDRDENQFSQYHFGALQQPPAIFVGKQELVNYGRNVSMFAGPSPRILSTCLDNDMLDMHSESQLTGIALSDYRDPTYKRCSSTLSKCLLQKSSLLFVRLKLRTIVEDELQWNADVVDELKIRLFSFFFLFSCASLRLHAHRVHWDMRGWYFIV